MWLRVPYGIAARTAELLSRLAPANSRAKVWRAFRARRGLLERYETWAAAHRDPTRPLIWIHAASVGEGLMALPVMHRLRAQRPDAQIAYTYFSPSAESFAASVPADFTAYLPFDTERSARRALTALRPTLLAFSKVDVWPTLAHAAHARGVTLALISASMPDSSSRRSGIGAALIRHAYGELDAVGAASAGDATRLIESGVRPTHVRVTGDTRYDQAWARAHVERRHHTVIAALRSERPTLVAGSTWPADERPLLAAWLSVRAAHPTARLILAPHELAPAHLADSHLERIEAWGRDAGLRVQRAWASPDAPPDALTPGARDADVLLVNRMGILADLYALATVSYVGGGFHDAGLHSLVEPAVFGTPILFGPKNAASRDAALMRDGGGAHEVTDRAGMGMTLTRLLGDAGARHAMESALAAVVSDELGATDRSATLLGELLDGKLLGA